MMNDLIDRPTAQSNLQPTCNQLATDCISRQAAIKTLAYNLIDQLVASPFDYNDENREDLLTLGAIFWVISAVDAICKKEEQE